jgi:hypothetical protein
LLGQRLKVIHKIGGNAMPIFASINLDSEAPVQQLRNGLVQ